MPAHVFPTKSSLRHKLGISYEYIRVIPSSAFLYEMDELELQLAKNAAQKISQVIHPMATDSSGTGLTSVPEEMDHDPHP